MVVVAHLLSRAKWNAFSIVIFSEVMIIVAYIMLLKVERPGIRYFALLINSAFAGIVYPALWPRRVEALRGTAGSALGIGKCFHKLLFTFSNLGRARIIFEYPSPSSVPVRCSLFLS